MTAAPAPLGVIFRKPLCNRQPLLPPTCYDCIYRCATSGTRRRTGSTRKSIGSHSKWRLWPLKTNAALCVQTVWTKPESNDGTRLGQLDWARMPQSYCSSFMIYREEIDGEEITRIISARRANKDDFRRYQEQEMD